MTQPKGPQRKQLVLGSTVAVILVFTLIVLFAAFSPPSPEGVVSRMLDSLARQDMEAFKQEVTQAVQQELASTRTLDSSRWEVFWAQGPELFDNYRIGKVKVSGDEAEVLVFYGPGLIQEELFSLRKLDGGWQVIDFNE